MYVGMCVCVCVCLSAWDVCMHVSKLSTYCGSGRGDMYICNQSDFVVGCVW